MSLPNGISENQRSDSDGRKQQQHNSRAKALVRYNKERRGQTQRLL